MPKFKTRARTIEMLGRQQIANPATALSELFKNAHDAYAVHVAADYFETDNLLLIRDDGYGMTRREFEEKWLVIGTESKYGESIRIDDPNRPEGKPVRAIMGEKGIGRLAVALLGRQTLILTRAVRDGIAGELVMSFIHWGVFGIPALNLDDVSIPVKTIVNGALPDAKQVETLVSEFAASIRTLVEKNKVDAPAVADILNDLSNFSVDPEDMGSFLKSGPSLKESCCGSHFFIFPASSEISAGIRLDRKTDSRDFSKFLLGFSNGVFAGADVSPIDVSFNYWETDDNCVNLLSENEFFTRTEVEAADHLLRGEVDEFGQFTGLVRIYEERHADHKIPWGGNEGRPTGCGPFAVEFAYLQGEQRASRLPPDEWARMKGKLDNIGGLYVYRDLIRILPYGNSDVDWIDVEKRRTKKADYYFFSYRRIFGAVCLTKKHNAALEEKAGREGFIQNAAFRQLKDILENMFISLAADFFRKDAAYPDFDRQKTELERLELARRRREKMTRTTREKLTGKLDLFFNRIGENLPQTETCALLEQLGRKIDLACRQSDKAKAAQLLLEAEAQAETALGQLREDYRVAKPRGIGLSKQLQRDWIAYQGDSTRLEKDVFSPCAEQISRQVGELAALARVHIDQRKRVETLVSQIANTQKRQLLDRARELMQTADNTRTEANRVARKAVDDMKRAVDDIMAEFNRTPFSGMSFEQVESVRSALMNKIDTMGRQSTELLERIRDMLLPVSEALTTDSTVGQLEMMEATEQELLALRDQSELDAEMVQLGMAVAIINHEFKAAAIKIRNAVRGLRKWAAANQDLTPIYQAISENFSQLDAHLNLFTPLQRRLYRKPIAVTGGTINNYVAELFAMRLTRHHVSISTTEAFLTSQAVTYPSTVYPVFVNLVDNAIFWLTSVKDRPREIVFDAAPDGWLVRDTGPGIDRRDRDAVFERGFTRKPGGRGLGLFISREALRKEDMDILLLPTETGASFKILWSKSA